MRNRFKGILLAGLVLPLALALASCTKSIPEGPILDFVSKFNYDEAFASVSYATSVLTSVSYKDGKETGSAKTTTQIHKDKDNYYQYLITDLNGDYYGTGPDKFDYYHNEILTYGNIKEHVSYAKEIKDEAINDLEYSNNDLINSVTNYFYTQLKSGFHHGGMYYADYVLANCAKYYDYFSLDTINETLSFKLDSVSFYNDQKVINRHSYTVNKYGMVLSVRTRSELYDDLSTYSETIASCSYEKFDLKESLNIGGRL